MQLWIVGADGKTYGPFTAEQLRQFAQQGRVTMETLASPGGGAAWQPLSMYLFQGDPAAAASMTGELPPPTHAPVIPVPAGADQDLTWIVPVHTDGVAIAAGYAGLFSLLCFPGPFALGLGIWALRRLRGNPQLSGRGRAIFAIIAGSLGTIGTILSIVAVVNSTRGK